MVAQALYVRATAQPKDLDEEMASYTRILEEFDTDETASRRHWRGPHAVQQGYSAVRAWLGSGLISSFHAVDRTLSGSTDLDIQLQVAKAADQPRRHLR